MAEGEDKSYELHMVCEKCYLEQWTEIVPDENGGLGSCVANCIIEDCDFQRPLPHFGLLLDNSLLEDLPPQGRRLMEMCKSTMVELIEQGKIVYKRVQ